MVRSLLIARFSTTRSDVPGGVTSHLQCSSVAGEPRRCAKVRKQTAGGNWRIGLAAICLTVVLLALTAEPLIRRAFKPHSPNA